MMTPVALVGFGSRGRVHARALHAMHDIHLAAIVDLDPACAEDAKEFGAPWLAGLSRLDASIRHAVIATPAEYHASLACALARRGVHCLIEKPGGANAHDAATLIAASDIDGTCMRVGYIERFNPVIARLLASPAPATLAIRRHSSHALDIPQDGDVLRELLAHDLDWVCAIAGAAPVQIDILDARRHYERWEAIRCRLRFPNGMDVDISASRIATRVERAVHVAGQGVLPLEDLQADHDTLAVQMRAFLRACEDERTPLASLEQAFALHRVIDGIEQKASEHEASRAA